MKLALTEIRVTPDHLPFAFCTYGEPSERLQEWAQEHNFRLQSSGSFTNFEVEDDLSLTEVLEEPQVFTWMDGFSPNLEKSLHVGHLSNLILATALWHLGVAADTLTIFGDTVGGELDTKQSLNNFYGLIELFNYPAPAHVFYASQMIYNETGRWPALVAGEGTYEGTQGFMVEDEYVVGIKSDGSTSYFYQDLALRQRLMARPTLYLTGSEQNSHFEKLKKLEPSPKYIRTGIEHVGLGLVSVDGKKMSTREGNVIYAEDILNQVAEKFDGRVGAAGRMEVAANVLAGQILRSATTSNKSIDTETLANPKTSPGLYLTYTLVRMLSCGLDYDLGSISLRTQYAALRARAELQPVILFERLTEVCKEINNMYGKFSIKEDPAHAEKFQPLVNDLAFGMSALGMHLVDRV